MNGFDVVRGGTGGGVFLYATRHDEHCFKSSRHKAMRARWGSETQRPGRNRRRERERQGKKRREDRDQRENTGWGGATRALGKGAGSKGGLQHQRQSDETTKADVGSRAKQGTVVQRGGGAGRPE